jgi:hypothetical protein
MKHSCNVFDLWIFYRDKGVPRYLLMHTSQQKADKWFGGGRFWQVPGDFFQSEEEGAIEAIRRYLGKMSVDPLAIYACECVYTVYNRRFDALQTIPVFAAEIQGPVEVALTWQHSEYGWFTAEEAHKRINFWGLHEGLDRTKEYVTENENIPQEFCLWSGTTHH